MTLSVSEALSLDPSEEIIQVKAWVRTKRQSKDFSFVELNDGSRLANLQVILPSETEGYEANIERVRNGAALEVCGRIVKSQGKGQATELVAESFSILGDCDVDSYPLQKKRHTRETLRSMPHLRSRTNLFGAIFRLRSQASFAVHRFFEQRGFLSLQTPIISGSDCEGAGELFRATTLLTESSTGAKTPPDSEDFFGQAAHLCVSGQLEAEVFAASHGKVYTFGPTFRAENSNTSRHLAEFWMIEPEMAFYDLDANMELAKDFILSVTEEVLNNCEEDYKLFDKWVKPGLIESLEKLLKSSFEKLTYTEAIEILKKSGQNFDYPVEWGLDLQTEHERYISEEVIGGPVFIFNYPAKIKPFYMYVNEGTSENRTVRAMDLLCPGIGEIIGGSQREHRMEYLLQSMEDKELKEEGLEWYLDLRRFGTCEHSGFGLGFERLIMYLSGIDNIRDTIPFPRTPGVCGIKPLGH